MKQLLGFFLFSMFTFGVSASDWQKEVLIGFVRDDRGMVFQVYSGGCTDKDDFKIVLDNQANVTTLTLFRINPDYCKALLPFGRYITYTYEELNLRRRQPVQILNPLNPGFIY